MGRDDSYNDGKAAMASPVPHEFISPSEYLAIERTEEERHEYYRGEMSAMGGASRQHGLIGFNIARTLGDQLANRPCEAFLNDMRVKVSASGLYTYPDVVVTCENPSFEDGHLDTLLNPQLIVEILSDSTETYDRGRKFAQYRQIESLQDYVLVSQNYPLIERFSRQDDSWVLTDAPGLASSIELPSIDGTLRLADVYAKVKFEEN